MKKCDDCPIIPTVPGPVISARTLTNENAPLMTPKPKPDTAHAFQCSNDQQKRQFLHRDALYCKARYCYRMSSVCPSVTLVNCDHIGWNSSKIISPLVSLGCSLFATPT